MVYVNIDCDNDSIHSSFVANGSKNSIAKKYYMIHRKLFTRVKKSELVLRKHKYFYRIKREGERCEYNKGGYIIRVGPGYIIMGDCPDADFKKNISKKKGCNCRIYSAVWKVTDCQLWYKYPTYDDLMTFKRIHSIR